VCGKNCVASPASLCICGSTALRRQALRPQLKRDPLGTHELMENHELNPDDLEPEFRRIGTNAYDALRELVNRNLPGREDAVAPSESIKRHGERATTTTLSR